MLIQDWDAPTSRTIQQLLLASLTDSQYKQTSQQHHFSLLFFTLLVGRPCIIWYRFTIEMPQTAEPFENCSAATPSFFDRSESWINELLWVTERLSKIDIRVVVLIKSQNLPNPAFYKSFFSFQLLQNWYLLDICFLAARKLREKKEMVIKVSFSNNLAQFFFYDSY